MAYDYDFSGWATRNDYLCSDGRTIRQNAFAENNGKEVPLVWQHNHSSIVNVIGHALLENRPEGVYAYCSFNDSEMADHAKECVKHKDIKALSIFAKVMKEVNKNVMHGDIQEVSLVLTGANPGAVIETVMEHSDDTTEGIEYFVYDEEVAPLSLEAGSVEDETISHADKPTETKEEKPVAEEKKKTVEDVLNELSGEQSAVVEYVMKKAVKAAVDAAIAHNDKEENTMAHSVFENVARVPAERPMISPEDVGAIIKHAAQSNCGSLKLAVGDYLAAVNEAEEQESIMAHSDDGGVIEGDTTGVEYGIADIDWLFPNAKNLFTTPQFIKRRTEWVRTVFDGVRDVPFSRIKTMFMDITADEARAKGYVKGTEKVEEVVRLLKRETTPTTIYKKQKLDHDDVLDITDFDVIAFLKGEMRLMWEEEVARAMIVGDGRDSLSPDKIDETKIRPIYSDASLFSIPERVTIPHDATDDQRTKLIIRKMIKAQDDYEGSGNPIFLTTQGFVSDALLLEDADGRPRYDNLDKLTTALRVSKIVTVPVLKNVTRVVDEVTYNLVGIVVNLNDYARGADRAAKAEFFQDFDLDFNQHKMLYEGRCSGALVVPHSALVIEYNVAAASNAETNSTPAEEPAQQPAG